MCTIGRANEGLNSKSKGVDEWVLCAKPTTHKPDKPRTPITWMHTLRKHLQQSFNSIARKN